MHLLYIQTYFSFHLECLMLVGEAFSHVLYMLSVKNVKVGGLWVVYIQYIVCMFGASLEYVVDFYISSNS